MRKSRNLVTFGQTTDSQDQGVEQNLYKDVNMLSQLLGSGTTRIAVSLQQGLILIVEQGWRLKTPVTFPSNVHSKTTFACDLSVKNSKDKCYFISSGLQPGTSWWGGYWVYTSAIWRKDFFMKLVNRWCCLVLNGTVWYCMLMVAYGITCYSMLYCIFTKEMVLSDWPNTGAGWEKTSKSGCCKAFPSSISIF